jgi:BioD-like phosphotransacetylase family protein
MFASKQTIARPGINICNRVSALKPRCKRHAEDLDMKLTYKLGAIVVAVASVCGSAIAQGFSEAKEDAAQLQSDKAALQRQLNRLEADEARLKSDAASGRMSSESKDAYQVYTGKQAIEGTRKDLAADKAGSMQMKSDKAALQRQIKRLDAAEARLKGDTDAGKMASMSKDSEKVFTTSNPSRARKRRSPLTA